MVSYILVALGGAFGSALRYAMSRWTFGISAAPWPVGTFLVNVIGSFLLGVVVETCSDVRIFGVDARLVLGTGVLGGFTTYSSFNLETLQMAQADMWPRAVAYVAATVVTCLGAGVLGFALGRAL